jgi:hypothetical protein
MMAHLLKRHTCRVAMQENICLAGKRHRQPTVIVTLFWLIAALERALISERTLAGHHSMISSTPGVWLSHADFVSILEEVSLGLLL